MGSSKSLPWWILYCWIWNGANALFCRRSWHVPVDLFTCADLACGLTVGKTLSPAVVLRKQNGERVLHSTKRLDQGSEPNGTYLTALARSFRPKWRTRCQQPKSETLLLRGLRHSSQGDKNMINGLSKCHSGLNSLTISPGRNSCRV